jgi:mannosyltransferase
VPEIFAVARHLDVVHVVYYLFMHVWISILGSAPWALRLPSVIAVGVASAGVVVLGRQVATPRLAVTAGLLFAVLPRVTWAGTEARSFAFVAVVAVWLTVVFMLAVRGRATWWILYAGLAVVGVLLFVYLALVVVAHGTSLILWWIRSRQRPRAVSCWAAASGAAAALTLPFVLVAVGQAGQIHRERMAPLRMVRQVGIIEWFLGAFPDRRAQLSLHHPTSWAVGAAALAVLCLTLAAIGFLRAARPVAGAGPSLDELAVPWAIVPTMAILAISEIRSPVYAPRYAIVSAPAVALLVAAGILSLRHRTLIAVTVAAIVLFAAPVYVEQRTGTAKAGSDWKYVAAVIGERGRPGDVVVFGKLARKEHQTTRKAAIAYPDDFVGLRDITLDRSALERTTLWPTSRPLADVTGDIEQARRVWLVSDASTGRRWQRRREEDLRVLASVGYRPTWTWKGSVTRIDELMLPGR